MSKYKVLLPHTKPRFVTSRRVSTTMLSWSGLWNSLGFKNSKFDRVEFILDGLVWKNVNLIYLPSLYKIMVYFHNYASLKV